MKILRYEHRRIPGTFGGCKVWQILEDGTDREHDGECYTVKGAQKFAKSLNRYAKYLKRLRKGES